MNRVLGSSDPSRLWRLALNHKSAMSGYWVKRYEQQGERTVGNSSLTAAGLVKKSAEASELLSRFLTKNGLSGPRCLDFGCGVGRMLATMRDFYGHVCGIDIIPWPLEQAQKRFPLGEFVLFDGTTIPFPDGHFDAVLAWTVLQHIPSDELPSIAREIGRVLHRNGRVILYENVSTWIPDKLHIWFRLPSEYMDLFPGFAIMDLQQVPGADDNEEQHALMLLREVK